MNLDEITLIYAYDRWADQRILSACAHVSADQYVAETPFGNLRGTLIHKIVSQQSWLFGFQNYFVPAGSPPSGDAPMWEFEDMDEKTLPTLAALNDRWQVASQDFQAYLDALTDEELGGTIRYMIPGGIVRERRLSHCLFHLANHGTQHRSEAAAILTSYGQSPGGMDFTLFLNEYFNLPG